MAGVEAFFGSVYLPGYWASGGRDDLGVWSGGSPGITTATLSGVLSRVGDPATAVIGGQSITLRAYSDLTDGVLFTTPDFATFYAFTSAPIDPAQPYRLSYTVAGQSELACFVAGTRIVTPRGPVAVERLRPGALVCSPGGRLARVRWVGRRRLVPAGPRAWPVRIAPHALAAGRPRRAVLLSPDHAVQVAGAMIPAHLLLNGATVTRLKVAAVTYWHVELTRPALLLTEGLAVESFRDTGNRRGFDRCGPGRPALTRALGAKAGQGGPAALLRARRLVLARAACLGHAATDDPGLELHAGGRVLAAGCVAPWCWRTAVPAGVGEVRLVSRSAVPAEQFLASTDPRRLGLAVTGLTLDGAAISPTDPRRAAGWHRAEPGWQWTGGDALLLCGAAARRRVLEIAAVGMLRYWRGVGVGE